MIQTIELSNGITIVYEQVQAVRSVSIGVWLKNGSIDENDENNGISHVIEHMMFKGTKTRGAKEIADEMASIGGHINAFTAKEYTCYYAHVLDEHLPLAIEVLGDMLTHPLFLEKELEKEKGVILEEIAMSEDYPEDIVHDQLENLVFVGSPYARDILGTKQLVKSMKREQLFEFHQERFNSKNMVIALCGSFQPQEVQTLISEHFKDVPCGNENIRDMMPTRTQQFIFKEKEIEQIHMVINYPAIGYLSDDNYVLSILNTLIGGGINSKLFLGIREEKGLTYSIYSYVESYKDVGMFNIYAATSPGQIEDVIVNTFVELEKFLKEGIEDKELLQLKQQLKSNLIIGYENMNNRMSHYGKSKLVLGRVQSLEEIIEGIEAVTKERLMEMAKNILGDPTVSVSLVGNMKEKQRERVQLLCKKLTYTLSKL